MLNSEIFYSVVVQRQAIAYVKEKALKSNDYFGFLAALVIGFSLFDRKIARVLAELGPFGRNRMKIFSNKFNSTTKS
jgi:hypothetical protein